MTGNTPFHKILKDLGKSTVVITDVYLAKIYLHCIEAGLVLPSILYAVQVLKFLEEHGCVKIDSGDQDIKVTGLFNYD